MKVSTYLAAVVVILSACARASGGSAPAPAATPAAATAPAPAAAAPKSNDPRVGLKAGWMDAGEAVWNLRVVSRTPPSKDFMPAKAGDYRWMNSDLSFSRHYAIQGNFGGVQVWDISNPAKPMLKTAYVCPASQSDVSVYGNLLFISGEGLGGRLDCGTQGVRDTVSQDRLRGLRIFDISDITMPKNVGNVQTCRGSHTHTVLVPPNDPEHVYVYISGSAPPRSPDARWCPSSEVPTPCRWWCCTRS